MLNVGTAVRGEQRLSAADQCGSAVALKTLDRVERRIPFLSHQAEPAMA
jgi:hypothetical protein